MKRNTIVKVVLSLVLCLGMLFTAIPNTRVSAAAKITNKEARKILKKKIKNKFCKYVFVDVDKDKIDELIVLGFSDKFTDGDSSEKTLTVYKVKGKKAKEYLSYSIDGDLFHPVLSFDLYYSDGESYITVVQGHEGYFFETTYQLGAKYYKQVARFEDYVSGDEQYYYRRTEECTEKEYNAFIKSISGGRISYKLKSPTKKVANKYLKKMLMAEFEYQCKLEVFDKDVVSTVFSDEDGDGIDELIVRQGPLGGVILYVVMPEQNSVDYLVQSTDYTIDNGSIIYGAAG